MRLKEHLILLMISKWFFSIGRAGTYRYAVDIDDCIEQAIEIGKIINNGNYSSPLPLKKWQELN